MDVVVLHGSVDQSFSPYRSHLRSPRKIQPFILSPYDHFPATGVLSSYPSQPPLLPLPATGLRRSATMYPPNGNRRRDSSLTPKKSKYAKKESPKKPITASTKEGPKEADMFSGAAAFAISPPPSSLPLPTFSLRPKMVSCKVEAVAGIDTGATDDLRRLLRLR